jgi:hypothetical protein
MTKEQKMYKDPQLSDAAKRLRSVLSDFKLKLTHAQALEVCSRLEGSRTLHVAHARKNAGVSVAAAAYEQACVVMFDSLGPFEGRVDELLQRLEALRVETDAAEVDRQYRAIFKCEHPVALSAGFDHLSAEDVPAAFAALVGRLNKKLNELAKPSKEQARSPLFQGPMLHWMAHSADEVEELKPHRKVRYEVKIERSVSQFYVDIAPEHASPDDLTGQHQMGLFIEVNEGLPCVHITNDVFGDQVLTVFATKDGLYLRPDGQEFSIRTGVPGESHPSLDELHTRESEGFGPRGRAFTSHHAFIVASNEP